MYTRIQVALRKFHAVRHIRFIMAGNSVQRPFEMSPSTSLVSLPSFASERPRGLSAELCTPTPRQLWVNGS